MAGKLTPKQARFVDEYRTDGDAQQAAFSAGLTVYEGGGEPRSAYVYGLFDPANGELFYVGKGNNGRWLEHYREAYGEGNQRKRARARAASNPACVIFVEGVSDEEAFSQERRLILALREGLTNIAPGQRSERERSQERATEMLSKIMPFNEWRQRRTRTPDEVMLYHAVRLALLSIADGGKNVELFMVTMKSIIASKLDRQAFWANVATDASVGDVDRTQAASLLGQSVYAFGADT